MQNPATPPLFEPSEFPPLPFEAQVSGPSTEITLRDLFACFVAAGAGDASPRTVARYAYEVADCLLAERERTK